MSDTKPAHGSCLCGKVHVTTSCYDQNVYACHCGMCRKWTGGPLFSVDCGTDVTFDGAENVGIYSSSDWAERGFCKSCGTSLFYRVKGYGAYFMPAGLFDDVEDFHLQGQTFIDRKPDYYTFANKTLNKTEAEVMAMYADEIEALKKAQSTTSTDS